MVLRIVPVFVDINKYARECCLCLIIGPVSRCLSETRVQGWVTIRISRMTLIDVEF